MKELLGKSKNIFVVVYQGIWLNGEYVSIYNLLVPTNAHVIYRVGHKDLPHFEEV
jgi:hypothetical protein